METSLQKNSSRFQSNPGRLFRLPGTFPTSPLAHVADNWNRRPRINCSCPTGNLARLSAGFFISDPADSGVRRKLSETMFQDHIRQSTWPRDSAGCFLNLEALDAVLSEGHGRLDAPDQIPAGSMLAQPNHFRPVPSMAQRGFRDGHKLVWIEGSQKRAWVPAELASLFDIVSGD